MRISATRQLTLAVTLAGLTLLTGAAGWLQDESASASTLNAPTAVIRTGQDAQATPLPQHIAPDTALLREPELSATAKTLQLLRQLSTAGHEENLFRLKTLLGNADSPEGLPVAQALLRDADPAMRELGVDILTGRSLTDPAVHRIVVQTLSNEVEPRVLVRLLNNLDAPIDAYGNDPAMTDSLHALLRHDNADVRSQTVLQLLQWDDYGTLEGYLYQALNDVSGEVRLSAATVISLIDTRSTTLKGALLALRDNPQESRDIHESVVAALSRIDDYNQNFTR